MLIEWISLKNIKSFADAKIHFKRGVNFIKGPNGAGKSTIIEAVGFALFNVTTTGFAGGIHSYLLRDGEREGEVSVCFSANGERYTVTRTVSAEAGRRKWSIWQDDLQITGLMNDRDRVAFLQDVLGLPPEQKTEKLFTDMIGVRQGQFKAPFEETITNRVKYFNEIFGVSEFNRARDNMISTRRTIQSKRAEYKNLIGVLSGTVTQYTAKKEEFASQMEAQKEADDAWKALSAQVARAKESYSLHYELETLNTEIEMIRQNGEKQMAAVKEEIEELSAQIALAQKKEENEKNKLRIHAQIREKLDGAIAGALAVMEKDAKSLQEYMHGTVQKIALQRESVIKSLEDAQAEAGKLSSGICPYYDEPCEKMQGRVVKSRMEPLNAQRKEIEERYCTALVRPRNLEWRKHVAAFLDEAGSLCDRYGKELPEISELTLIFEKYCQTEGSPEALYDGLAKLADGISAATEICIEIKGSLTKMVAEENKALIEDCAASTQIVKSLQKSIAESKKKLEVLTREKELLNKKTERRDEILQALGEGLSNLNTVQAELMRINGEAERADEQRRMNRKILDSLQKDIDEMEKTRAQIDEYEKKDASYAKAGSAADLLVDLLRRAGGRVAELYTGRVSEKAQSLYAGIARDGARLHFDTEYDAKLVDIYKGKERQRSFNQLSGGQKMVAALCVRIAILNSFTGIPIVFFDEPTENIDAEKKQNLAENLRKPLQGFTQIFIISHDDAFDRLTENVILLEEARGGTVCVAL